MISTIIPADPMVDVLTDAIASKRDTIMLLQRAAKDAEGDLQHLRHARALLLAKAAGVIVGDVYLLSKGDEPPRPAIVIGIAPSLYSTREPSNDWRATVAFDARMSYGGGREMGEYECANWCHGCAGAVALTGHAKEQFNKIFREIEDKAKAA